VTDKPRLVLISGAPGTGKTTLATKLAADLKLPLITKDGLKETIGDALGVSSLEESIRLGRATFPLLFCVANAILQGSSGLILESAFAVDLSERELEGLCGLSDARLIRCTTSPEIAMDRYARRKRHPVHRDNERHGDLDVRLRSGYYDIVLPVPTLEVETSDGYEPGYEDVIAFARS
jgi:predicted kinase